MSVCARPPEAALAPPLLNRANPLSKIIAAMIVLFALLLSLDLVSAGVALLFELLLLPLAGLRLGVLLRRGWPILLAALGGAYGTALLAEKTGEAVFDAGPLLLTTGSIAAAAAVLLRSLAIAVPGLLLLASTDPTDLADALAQRARLPERFVLGGLAAMRLVGLLVQEWQILGQARRARGASGGTRGLSAVRATAAQSTALLVQALRRAGRLAAAMEAKGFGAGRRTWARPSHFSRLDFLVICGGIAIAVVSVAAALLWGTWNPVFW
ncbi:energy-coupling factor transporter transmembrane component T family protein [Acaricomes phytoseiuli]|uniref:energy-coupling factor transporter transmembrane component T family protein n=1 Tax=Acaricomes phytoseiuli TaxID=291968 RepID=UPI000378EA45|nr:energy-coupling factor transporter transmembrane component T [Acaricomes phytoseiuli]